MGVQDSTMRKLQALRITLVRHLMRQIPTELERLFGMPARETKAAQHAVALHVGARRQCHLSETSFLRASTGVGAVDRALGGGVGCGCIAEFCGRGGAALAASTLRASPGRWRVHVSVGSVSKVITNGATRLMASDLDALMRCVDAIRSDAIAMRMLIDENPPLVVIDGLMRMFMSLFRSQGRTRRRVRGAVDRVIMGLRSLTADTGAAVILINPRMMAQLGKPWLPKPDTRITFDDLVCLRRGCYQDYDPDIDALLARRSCMHVRAKVERKDGGSKRIIVDFAASGVLSRGPPPGSISERLRAQEAQP